MRARASSSVLESLLLRVVHVVLVVRTIDILPVPARREMMYSHDTALTRLRWKVRQLGESGVFVGEADEAEADVLLGSVERIRSGAADRHAEALCAVSTKVL
jgi:hypothetical protein